MGSWWQNQLSLAEGFIESVTDSVDKRVQSAVGGPTERQSAPETASQYGYNPGVMSRTWPCCVFTCDVCNRRFVSRTMPSFTMSACAKASAVVAKMRKLAR